MDSSVINTIFICPLPQFSVHKKGNIVCPSVTDMEIMLLNAKFSDKMMESTYMNKLKPRNTHGSYNPLRNSCYV